MEGNDDGDPGFPYRLPLCRSDLYSLEELEGSERLKMADALALKIYWYKHRGEDWFAVPLSKVVKRIMQKLVDKRVWGADPGICTSTLVYEAVKSAVKVHFPDIDDEVFRVEYTKSRDEIMAGPVQPYEREPYVKKENVR